MNVANNIVINIYSIALLIVICIQSIKQDEKESFRYKIYMKTLQVTLLLLVLDILSRFDGKPDTIYSIINHVGNFLVFLMNLILPSLWLLYVHDQVYQDEFKTRRLIFPLVVLNGANAIILVFSQFFGWFYYIDSHNIYHRGPLFMLSLTIIVSLLFWASALSVVKRNKVAKSSRFALIFFAIPPFLGIMLQTIFYGTSLMLVGVVLSLLIVFLNIQNHSIYIDYLTEVNNRRKLDIYMKEKIRSSTPQKTFSAIMIDLNDFKSINDTYGHDVGDEVLRTLVKLLKGCLKSTDFIARYGGDEFCIVLDVSDKIQLEGIVFRINRATQKYNKFSNLLFHIGFSMGYSVYDYDSHMEMEEFQKEIDLLMYANKQSEKIK